MTSTKTKELQRSLFQRTWEHAATNSPFYKRMCVELGIDKSAITLDSISQLPFTTKANLQGHEREFLCVPESKVVEYVTTSGTLGSPVTFMLTEKDLERLAHNEFLSLSCADGNAEDIYQIMVTLDKRFMAGMAYYLGARKLGSAVVRTGVESLAFQLDTILRIKPTALIAVPSFVIKLIAHCKEAGVDLNDTTIKKLICIGEPIRRPDFGLNTLGQRIADQWNIKLYSTYASTEMGTAFTECSAHQGGHHQPELIIAEILDPEGNPVPDGEAGELVVTPLGIEAMPLIRFRTGDICRKHVERCACGKETMRLGPIEGRRQQMIKFKGTSLYPPALFDVMNGMEDISEYLVTLRHDDLKMDDVLVEYCCTKDEIDLEDELKEKFRSYIRVVPKLSRTTREALLQKTTNPLSRKAIRLIDERN